MQQHFVQKQRALLQLLSMGVDLEDVEGDFKENEMTPGQVKQAFMDGVDGSQANVEDKIIHDEDDDDVRMAAIVYDSDDERKAHVWESRSRWQQKALNNAIEKELAENAANPKPWQKLHSKYVDEFVNKFCGFYSYESRPVAWKRVWHCYTNDQDAADEWPGLLLMHAFFFNF